eukprot:3205239-Amphidinium_carterae.1
MCPHGPSKENTATLIACKSQQQEPKRKLYITLERERTVQQTETITLKRDKTFQQASWREHATAQNQVLIHSSILLQPLEGWEWLFGHKTPEGV